MSFLIKSTRLKKILSMFIVLVVLSGCISIFSNDVSIEEIQIKGSDTILDINDSINYDVIIKPENAKKDDLKLIVKDKSLLDTKYENGTLTIKSLKNEGKTEIYFETADEKSNVISIQIIDQEKKAAQEAEAKKKAEEEAAKKEAEEVAKKKAEEEKKKAEQKAQEAQKETKNQTTTTQNKSSSNKTTSESKSNTTHSSGAMVYIPRTGKKYHSHPNCGSMKNPSQVSLSEAQAMGYTPCKKCY